MLEDMRVGKTDTELFESLPEKLRGHVWIGDPKLSFSPAAVVGQEPPVALSR